MPAILSLKLDKIFFPKLIKDVYKFEALSAEQSAWRMAQEEKRVVMHDLFAGLLQATDPETGVGFTEEENISEAGLLIIAGSDTMATGITSTIFYLLHYPDSLTGCQNEIRSVFKDDEEIRVGQKLSSCVYLMACLNEAMRLTPGVGGILPRETLKGGIIVDGEYFPERVDLGVPHYAIQHNGEYFPDPFVFKPARWILQGEVDGIEGVTPESLAIANSAFCPFSHGRASCVGKTIAYQEMSIILARIIWLYDMRLAAGAAGRIGEGSERYGYGRKIKNEFQVLDNFTSRHNGPMVEFKNAAHV